MADTTPTSPLVDTTTQGIAWYWYLFAAAAVYWIFWPKGKR